MALTAVITRLKQVHSLWFQALNAYFAPHEFRIAIQNCISTCRTVTFILQSNKSAIPDFDTWYKIHTQKFDADSIMQWAKHARNKIEKQGDLETLSQLQAELIAAYAGHPITQWIPTDLFSSVEQIRHSIPAKWLNDPHMVEHGVLLIRRRWIDVELPGHEILDALAHVYGQLALMIISLHEHCGVPIPKHNPELGVHLLAGLRSNGRLPSMEHHLEDRVTHISIKNGSVLQFKEKKETITRPKLEKASKRYGDVQWERLATAESLLDVAHIHFNAARQVILRDHEHRTVFVLLKGNVPFEIIGAEPQDRMDKYMLMRKVAQHVRDAEADGVLHIGESWVAKPEDVPKGGYAADAANRKEALLLLGVNAQGQHVQMQSIIERKKVKRHKIKQLLPTEVYTDGKPISMAPVLEVWGKLDILGLNSSEGWPEGY